MSVSGDIDAAVSKSVVPESSERAVAGSVPPVRTTVVPAVDGVSVIDRTDADGMKADGHLVSLAHCSSWVPVWTVQV